MHLHINFSNTYCLNERSRTTNRRLCFMRTFVATGSVIVVSSLCRSSLIALSSLCGSS